jgi:hypothetical protein
MTVAAPPTVIEALSAVMGDVQSVSKTGRNQQQNYNFRGIDAVVNAVGPALRKHKVVVIPIYARVDKENYTTKSGTAMKNVTLTVGFRFFGPKGDSIDAEACGEAADSGDKAISKAHSVAYRTLLLQALCIPTDEPDPDQDSHERNGKVSAGEPRMATPIPAAADGSRPSPAGSSQLADLPGSTFEDVFEAKEPHVGVTAQQKKKLNVLVGTLCEKGLVHTEHLYQAVASMRDTDPDIWIAGAIELSDDGELHYGPLRDSLSKEEASSLIDRLSRFEATTAAVHEETQ